MLVVGVEISAFIAIKFKQAFLKYQQWRKKVHSGFEILDILLFYDESYYLLVT